MCPSNWLSGQSPVSLGRMVPASRRFSPCSRACNSPTRAKSCSKAVISTDDPPHGEPRSGIARTFQKPEVFVDLTVREHLVLAHRIQTEPARTWSDLILAGSLRRASSVETESVERLLQLLALDAVASRPAQGLPIGTTRRLEIARALASQPTALLLDEPCSGLDPAERDQCESIFQAAVAELGISILIVEHDTELVLRMASHVTVLDFGQCIAAASPAVIRRDPAVAAAFLGDLSDSRQPQ